MSVHPHALQRYFSNAGYVRIPEAIPSEDVEKLDSLLCREFDVPAENYHTIRNSLGTPTKLYQILQRPDIGEALRKSMIRSEKIRSTARAILGPNVALTLNRHNHATNNYPGDNLIRMHRDVLQPSRNIVSAILYLDASTEANGATVIVPGSHREPFVGIPQRNGGGTWMDEHEDFAHLADQALIAPAGPGDMLLFDGTLFHTLGENHSGERRRSIALGFKAIDELSEFQLDRELLLYGQDIYRGNDV